MKIIQLFSSLKLKQKIRYIFLFIITIYLLFYLFMFSFLFNTYMTDYALENNRNNLVSIGNRLMDELDKISDMSRLLMANNDLVRYLKNSEGASIRNTKDAEKAIFDIISAFDNIYSIFVFKNDTTYLHTGRDITLVDREIVNTPEWRKDINEKAGGYVVKLNNDGAFTMNTGEPIISVIRQIYDLNNQELLGMLVVNVPVSILENTTKGISGEKRKYYYFDTNNNNLTQDEMLSKVKEVDVSVDSFNQKVNRSLFNEEVISYYHIPDMPLVIVSYERIGYEDILSKEATWVPISIMIITTFALLLISSFISVYITKPIQRLVQSMSSVKTGLFKRVSLSLPDDEIGRLKDSYNRMLLEINHLINELIDKEKSIQQAEMEVLQEQIKPHFLYNTIDTIRSLALENSAMNVYDALETLGDFYRKFLSKGEKEITIEDEIGIVKDYLKLQKLRYEDVFEDSYELQEDVLQFKIPKLILQPLAENSLYHGIREKGEKGIIKISVCSEGNHIYIAIYDNGIGMSQKQIEEIMSSDNKKSFGFRRTIERIRYYFNRDDVYEIESKEGEYTKIVLKIPYSNGVVKNV